MGWTEKLVTSLFLALAHKQDKEEDHANAKTYPPFKEYYLRIFVPGVNLQFLQENPVMHYANMPHTSIGGQFLGFEIYRSRGKKEKQGRKRQKEEKN